MKDVLQSLFLVACLGCLTACSSVENLLPTEAPTFSIRHDARFDSRPEIINLEEITKLTPQQEQDFLDYFYAEKQTISPAHQRVSDYLVGIGENITFSSQTNTAAQTLRQSQGNCLSLAILTTALASLAKVDIAYQLADSTPIFRFNDNVVFKGVHVRSMLYDSGAIAEEGHFYIRRPGIRVDYFPNHSERFIGNISKSDFAARYYRNLAATAISSEDYSRAYWLVLESMEFEPLSSDAFVAMGVIHRRSGNHAIAEEIYQYGIEHLPAKLSLLKNYRVLLNLQQRYAEAEKLTRRIKALNDPSPFNFIHAAQESYAAAQYDEAIHLYQKALNIAPYIHEARLALAQSHYQLGQLDAARKQLQEALNSTQRRETRSLYLAKLHSLNREL